MDALAWEHGEPSKLKILLNLPALRDIHRLIVPLLLSVYPMREAPFCTASQQSNAKPGKEAKKMLL
jgi:hypothetical protein